MHSKVIKFCREASITLSQLQWEGLSFHVPNTVFIKHILFPDKFCDEITIWMVEQIQRYSLAHNALKFSVNSARVENTQMQSIKVRRSTLTTYLSTLPNTSCSMCERVCKSHNRLRTHKTSVEASHPGFQRTTQEKSTCQNKFISYNRFPTCFMHN